MFQVLLAGVDITDRISGTIRVTRKERIAAIASVIYAPSGTPDLPLTMAKKSVQIFENAVSIFLGKVNTATWDPKLRQYTLNCSDMFQEVWEAKTEAEVFSALPNAVYSENIFGEREDGWRQAQECMRTIRQDVYLSPVDNSIQTPNWEAKGTADFSYTGAQVLWNGAYQMDLMNSRDIVTQVKIEYQYRVSRWKVRTHDWSWSMFGGAINDFCDWMQNFGVPPAPRGMLASAAEGTGWQIATTQGFLGGNSPWISYDAPPPPGSYCGGIGWSITDEARASLAFGVRWRGLRNWAQTVTETIKMELNCDAAQAGNLGAMPVEERAAFAPEVDDASFEDAVISEYSSWPTDNLQDHYQDQDDDTQRVLDLDCLIALGVTQLWANLRGNSISFEIPIEEALDLAHTVQVDTADFSAKGKVRAIEHVITLERATTKVTLAISQGGGGALTVPGAPTRPDTSPGHVVPYPPSTVLSTWIGGCSDSPLYDPTIIGLEGYTGNRFAQTCPGGGSPSPDQIYPQRFKVDGHDIEDEARNEVTAEGTSVHNINVPQDTLVLY